MRRTALTALTALCALALTGCGPTTDDVLALIDEDGRSYDDVLELREDVIDAGVECPGDQQQTDSIGASSITGLRCNDNLILAVADDPEGLSEITSGLQEMEGVYYLQASNWLAASLERSPLERIQEDLGGTVAVSGR